MFRERFVFLYMFVLITHLCLKAISFDEKHTLNMYLAATPFATSFYKCGGLIAVPEPQVLPHKSTMQDPRNRLNWSSHSIETVFTAPLSPDRRDFGVPITNCFR